MNPAGVLLADHMRNDYHRSFKDFTGPGVSSKRPSLCSSVLWRGIYGNSAYVVGNSLSKTDEVVMVPLQW